MPCICHGAMSGKEGVDAFLKTVKGAETFQLLQRAAHNIINYDLDAECYDDEFRKAWMEAFLHMLFKCPDKGV